MPGSPWTRAPGRRRAAHQRWPRASDRRLRPGPGHRSALHRGRPALPLCETGDPRRPHHQSDLARLPVRGRNITQLHDRAVPVPEDRLAPAPPPCLSWSP
jgi:hypothetical protein